MFVKVLSTGLLAFRYLLKSCLQKIGVKAILSEGIETVLVNYIFMGKLMAICDREMKHPFIAFITSWNAIRICPFSDVQQYAFHELTILIMIFWTIVFNILLKRSLRNMVTHQIEYLICMRLESQFYKESFQELRPSGLRKCCRERIFCWIERWLLFLLCWYFQRKTCHILRWRGLVVIILENAIRVAAYMAVCFQIAKRSPPPAWQSTPHLDGLEKCYELGRENDVTGKHCHSENIR